MYERDFGAEKKGPVRGDSGLMRVRFRGVPRSVTRGSKLDRSVTVALDDEGLKVTFMTGGKFITVLISSGLRRSLFRTGAITTDHSNFWTSIILNYYFY